MPPKSWLPCELPDPCLLSQQVVVDTQDWADGSIWVAPCCLLGGTHCWSEFPSFFLISTLHLLQAHNSLRSITLVKMSWKFRENTEFWCRRSGILLPSLAALPAIRFTRPALAQWKSRKRGHCSQRSFWCFPRDSLAECISQKTNDMVRFQQSIINTLHICMPIHTSPHVKPLL